MKKSTILKLFSLLTFAAAGAFAVAAAKGSKKAEVAKADTDEVTLYINHFDAGSEKGGYWSNFKFYLFGTGGENASWPGESFTDAMKTSTPNEFDQYQYKLTIDTSKYQSMVLSGNSDSTWGYAFAKTVDITIADLEGNGLYCGEHKGWLSDANVFEAGTYTYSTKRVYMLDLEGDIFNESHYCHTFALGRGGTTFPGVEMSKVAGSNNLYYADINSNLDNVIFNDGSSSHQTSTIGSVKADNFAYVVYPDNGYNELSLQATEFIDSYMKFETVWYDQKGTGLCKTNGWYSAAKTAYNLKSGPEKLEILAHEPTQYRLNAWAEANKEVLNLETGAISSANYNLAYSNGFESSNLIIIVSIVSLISASTLVGLIVIKRRRGIAK